MPRATLADHLILIIGCVGMLGPLVLLLRAGLSSTQLTLAAIAMIPPLIVFLLAGRWIAKGLGPLRA